MASKADDPIEETVGITLGLFALGGIIALFIFGALVALVLFAIVGGAWLLWKRYRYSPATIAAREIAELQALRSSIAYLGDRLTLPDPDEMANIVIATVDDDLGDDRDVPLFLYKPIREATHEVIEQSGLAPLPELDLQVLRQSVDARNTLRQTLYRLPEVYQHGEAAVDAVFHYLCNCVGFIVEAMPTGDGFAEEPNDFDFTVELLDVIGKPKEVAETIIYLPFEWEVATLQPMRDATWQRMAAISGKRVDDLKANAHKPPKPSEQKGEGRDVLLEWLRGSPFLRLLKGRIAYRIPSEARFEHTHILAGTGHGKTQLIQRFVREDLTAIYFHHKMRLEAGIDDDPDFPKRSLVVIDGQGDMIDTIARRDFCSVNGPLRDHVILIDPTDTEYPLALNMFDVGQDDLARLDPVAREMVFNGTVELYVYLFGALLSAELTQKQDVLFRYVARLMLAIPNATLDTLRDVIEDGEKYQEHIDKLDRQSRDFFRTQFFGSTEFKDTKKQILRRLWGILSIGPLSGMFNSPVNKIDLSAELQEGKVILINTAKDFLKTDGARIFGRFWIAMIAQAALRRAAIAASERVDTHVYIDEAHEYIDDKVEEILNQARKYRIALHASHQNLSQLSPTQRATMASSTAIKMIGGVSDTEFLTYIRNHTESAIKLNVGFGTLERMDDMGTSGYKDLRDRVRERYATAPGERAIPMPGPKKKAEEENSPIGFQLGEHEPL